MPNDINLEIDKEIECSGFRTLTNLNNKFIITHLNIRGIHFIKKTTFLY